MGWIESYKSKGQSYYRYMQPGQSPIHLGSAVEIVRRVRPSDFAERKLIKVSPTEIYRGKDEPAHGIEDLQDNPTL